MAQKKYLALGDSYTIGEAVAENERFPMQLIQKLNEEEYRFSEPIIIAKTGWRTDQLMEAITERNISEKEFDLVSLLIGVNNQYRGIAEGYTLDRYEKEFSELLQIAIAFAGGKSNKVFVVSIPDYGVTPFVGENNLNPELIAKEIDAYNQIAKEICQQYQISFINITTISKDAKNNTTLIAEDGLHPSGKMYMLWVEEIFPAVKRILTEAKD